MGNRAVFMAMAVLLAIVFFPNNSFAQDKEGDDAGDVPWPCCNSCGACTKSIPPLCQCLDLVKACHPECKECVQSPVFIYPPLYQCEDRLPNFCENKCNAKLLNDE